MKLSRDRYIVDGMIVWIDGNTTCIRRGNLLISQRLPLKPSKQLHEQLLTASKHEPLLKHGWLAQSSISVKGIQKSKLQCLAQTSTSQLRHLLLSFLYVTERWNYWILCKISVKGAKVLETLPFWQYIPVKPGGQLQVQVFRPSMQDPPLAQV